MFGSVSMTELIDAQATIVNVIDFISNNKNSKDKDVLSAVRSALALICMQEILTQGVVSSLAKEVGDGIKSEAEVVNARAKTHSISIPIPTGEKS